MIGSASKGYTPTRADDEPAVAARMSPERFVRPAAFSVSVVIPTRDRPDLLEQCLDALMKQTLSPDRYEVIVVDDGPSLDTESVVEWIASQTAVRVKYVAAGNGNGPAAARNVGWGLASAPIVAFTDDDAIPDRRWLEAGIAEFTAGVTGVSGRIITHLPPRPTDYERDAAHLAEEYFVTANCFYRRDALAAIGGFDERFRAARREDTDVWFSMLEQGWRLVTAPAAVVVHPIRPAPWGSSLRQQRQVEYDALLRKKHPRLYRERIGHSPLWFWAAAAAIPSALITLAFGRRQQARLLGASWLAMTGAYAFKRLSGTTKRPAHVAEMVLTSAVIPPLSVYRRAKGAIRFGTLFW